MATNSKNSKFYAQTTLDSVPASTTKTGTITTNGPTGIIGSGTEFQDELEVGGWIFDMANYEMRKVTAISSQTALKIESAFTTPLAAATLKYVDSSNLVSIRVKIPSASSNGIVDSTTLPAGEEIVFTKSSRERSSLNLDFVDPIIVNGTGTTVLITTLK